MFFDILGRYWLTNDIIDLDLTHTTFQASIISLDLAKPSKPWSRDHKNANIEGSHFMFRPYSESASKDLSSGIWHDHIMT